MRACAAIVVVLAVAVAATASAQPPVPSVSGLLERVNTETSVRAVNAVPGGTVVLSLEVRPDRGIRVFAPGAKSFTPAIVVLNKPKGIKPGKPSYDTPAFEKNPGNDKRVPLYTRSFTITHTVTIDKNVRPGTVIGVAGALTYQTCDERSVYPRSTLPLRWTIRVEEPQ
jgi:hypothetical protein